MDPDKRIDLHVCRMGLWSLVLWLAAAGCAPDSPALLYQLRGGADGFDVTFRIDRPARAVYSRSRPRPERRTLTLAAEEMSAFEKQMNDGFFELAAEYRPTTPVVGGFEYDITWRALDGRNHRVRAADGAVFPLPLRRTLEAIGSLQRRVVTSGELANRSRLVPLPAVAGTSAIASEFLADFQGNDGYGRDPAWAGFESHPSNRRFVRSCR